MHILFLTYHFPTPDEPGAARPWEEARLLKESGYEVTVITAGTHYMTGEDTRKNRKGEKKQEYLKYCETNKVQNCVFLPAQPRERMPYFLEKADACIHSFENNDFWRCALSSKIFEYLAGGKPVVFAGKGDTADLILDADAGLVAEPEEPDALRDAILYLFNHPVERKQMGENGKKYLLTHFTREQMAQTLIKAVEG